MRHLSPLAKTQHAVRGLVCPKCEFRPQGSETWDANTRRPCEGQCAIFVNLPQLRTIVRKVYDPRLGAYEQAVRELVCQQCQLSPTSGDYCSERTTAHCPLSLYLRDVVDALERLERLDRSA